ncbi:MAG: hypothetical protein H6707_15260 [Deltaproteobacteria bacterium]|nr:hypothetical protein [Deltaproteobacteria bacterium]
MHRPPARRGFSRAFGAIVLTGLTALITLASFDPRGGTEIAAVSALPHYAARAARTCDNCHADPTGWHNPELSLRKCNLSCSTCHVNPTGGGMRTVAGRYYGQATLPLWFPSHRPAKDANRQFSALRIAKTRRNRLPDPAFGKPLGGSAPLAYEEERYNGLRADPLFQLGLDTRYAFWFAGATLFFPMQFDIHAALHPYKHLTIYSTSGFLAKSKGYAATFGRPTPFMVKDLFVMLHQLPYMSYVRVGNFLPPFGTYLDDHTVATRRDFGLHSGLLQSRVSGIELGLAPNYPYLNVAVFRPNRQDAFRGDDPDNDGNPPFFGVDGWGGAIAAGWRDLGWQLGVSAMLRRRGLEDGGDSEAVALSWGFNPWYYSDWLPLVYLGELAYGRKQRPVVTSKQSYGHMASFHQLRALVHNGVDLLVRYEFADPDFEIRDDHYHRLALGGDLILLPGFSIHGEFRMQFNAGADAVTTHDAVLYFRGWY